MFVLVRIHAGMYIPLRGWLALCVEANRPCRRVDYLAQGKVELLQGPSLRKQGIRFDILAYVYIHKYNAYMQVELLQCPSLSEQGIRFHVIAYVYIHKYMHACKVELL